MACRAGRCSSWRPRGTRTAQPLSRKWRLISPMMFGVAYVVSSTPRLDVEAVDRLDQADRPDLDEVLQLLAAAAEAPGAHVHQVQVQVHQLLAAGQPLLLTGAGRADLDEEGLRALTGRGACRAWAVGVVGLHQSSGADFSAARMVSRSGPAWAVAEVVSASSTCQAKPSASGTSGRSQAVDASRLISRSSKR